MPDNQRDLKKIGTSIKVGLACQYLPLFIVGILESALASTPGIKLSIGIVSVIASILFLYGYVTCMNAIDEYAIYKGYRNYWFVYSILNIFGLSILFLLKNKNSAENIKADKDPLERFSITAIFYSYIAIPLLITPFFFIPGLLMMGEEFIEYARENPDFNAFSSFAILIPFTWYFFREMRNVNLDRQVIFGSLTKLNWQLPVGLAVVEYFFAWGINTVVLYGLSFIFPEYLDSIINREYATSLVSWILIAIGSLIYAPIMEELFFRGIIFQKLAIKQSISKGILISAIAFALIHFRFDLIPLFTSGVVAAILYFKTKKLATPIINHFAFNLIVLARRLYFQIFPDLDATATTVLEYQQYVREHASMYVLFLAISAPCLIYFIYKNLPSDRNIDRLPYFVNQ